MILWLHTFQILRVSITLNLIEIECMSKIFKATQRLVLAPSWKHPASYFYLVLHYQVSALTREGLPSSLYIASFCQKKHNIKNKKIVLKKFINKFKNKINQNEKRCWKKKTYYKSKYVICYFLHVTSWRACWIFCQPLFFTSTQEVNEGANVYMRIFISNWAHVD